MSGFLGGGGSSSSGSAGSVTTTSTNNYNVKTTDGNIYVDLSAGSLTVLLPSSPTTGEFHTFKDYKGFASANPLTISGNGKNIEQFTAITVASTLTLNINYQSVTIQYNGTNWNVI